MPFDRTQLLAHIERSAATVAALARSADAVEAACAAIVRCFSTGGRVYTCGNGGSAAHALHLAEELIGRYRETRRPLPAVCLCADPTALTCIANDFGFEHVFSRQVQGLARRGDALVVFSTSGKSPNLVAALHTARSMGVTTIGLLGRGGGECAPLCDHAVVVAGERGEHVQEAHQVLIHLILESAEASIAGGRGAGP